MATNAKNLAELLNTDTTIADADIASGITASKLSGALPAISGENLTDVSSSTYVGEMLITGGGGSGGCGANGSYYGGGGGAGSCVHLMDMIFTVGEAVTVSAIGAGGTNNFSSANTVGSAGGSTTVTVGNSGKTYTLGGGGRGAAGSGGGATVPGGGGSFNAPNGRSAADAFSDPSINRTVGPFAGATYASGGQTGGGGGATASGQNTGIGGNGYSSAISGSTVQYSRGGHNPTDHGTNTGYGSGGNGGRPSNVGSNGVQGAVIIRIPTAAYSGTTSGSPTVTTSGNFTIITFTSTGSYTA